MLSAARRISLRIHSIRDLPPQPESSSLIQIRCHLIQLSTVSSTASLPSNHNKPVYQYQKTEQSFISRCGDAKWRTQQGTLRWNINNDQQLYQIKAEVFVGRQSSPKKKIGWLIINCCCGQGDIKFANKWMKVNGNTGAEMKISSSVVQKGGDEISLSSKTMVSFNCSKTPQSPGMILPESPTLVAPVIKALPIGKGNDLFRLTVQIRHANSLCALSKIVSSTTNNREACIKENIGLCWLSYSLFGIIVQTEKFKLENPGFTPVPDYVRRVLFESSFLIEQVLLL